MLLDHIVSGGPIMLPLLFLSVAVIALIIDRWRAFRAASNVNNLLHTELNKCFNEGDLVGAINACQKSSGPLAAVTLSGLNRYRQMLLKKRSLTEMETVVSKQMEDYAPRAIAGLEKRLNLLALIAGVGPLLGMTGTVTGMIKSFDVMRLADNVTANIVAGGISEALITTATGLIVAMPALAAYNIFSRRVDNYVLSIEEVTNDVMNYISDHS